MAKRQLLLFRNREIAQNFVCFPCNVTNLHSIFGYTHAIDNARMSLPYFKCKPFSLLQNLSQNFIRAEGGIALAEMLTKNQVLRKVILRGKQRIFNYSIGGYRTLKKIQFQFHIEK